MKRHFILLVCLLLTFAACTKKMEEKPQPSMANTSWQVTVAFTGSTSTQNIFEFNNNGVFAWHPAGAPSYRGTWTQSGTTVSFTFKESTSSGDYNWDNTGTLSADGASLSGTMLRRAVGGSMTFTAKKL